MKELRKFRQKFQDLFGQSLEFRGFIPTGKDVEYIREKAKIVQILSFAYRWEYKTESFRFHFFVSVRHLELEQLLGVTEEDRVIPFVALPIHLLREDQFSNDWYLDAPDTVPKVLEQIDKYAIPFLDKYSDLSAVEARLESEYPGDWFMLDKEERIRMLAILSFYKGRRTEALQMLDRAIEERKGKLPKYWYGLKQLRTILLSLPER